MVLVVMEKVAVIIFQLAKLTGTVKFQHLTVMLVKILMEMLPLVLIGGILVAPIRRNQIRQNGLLANSVFQINA